MGRIAYDDAVAAAFRAARHIPDEGLAGWRRAVGRYLNPRPGMRLLDLGAGTGAWAAAFTEWYGIDVLAVEPSASMRARSCYRRMVAGEAGALPVRTDSLDGAWLSTVTHHIADLPAAARELRRILRPGAPVLIRSAFPGRLDGIGLFRFFPPAARVVDRWPTVEQVRAVFTEAGFREIALHPVPQTTADSLKTLAATFSRDAHSPLKLISDADYEAGLNRLKAAADREAGPVVDRLDLQVFR